MEWIGGLLVSAFLGVRHGLDPDHMAAITDMVGTNTRASRGLKLGLMYALGHGLIVLLIGITAITVGKTLPESLLRGSEFLVGASVFALGLVIIWSLFRQRKDYKHQSRVEILVTFAQKVYRRLVKREAGSAAASTLPSDLHTFRVGLLGALCIGIVHGIGAETPTQLVIIGNSSHFGNIFMGLAILLMFVIGMLMSTSAVSFITAWGFMKARSMRVMNLVMGLLAGGYSVYLGIFIMLHA